MLFLAFPLKTTGERDKTCKKCQLLPLPPATCCCHLPILRVHLDCAFGHDPSCRAGSSTLRPDLPRLSQVPHSRSDQLQERNSVSSEAVQATMCNHPVTWKLNVYVEQKHFRGKKMCVFMSTLWNGRDAFRFPLCVPQGKCQEKTPPLPPTEKVLWHFGVYLIFCILVGKNNFLQPLPGINPTLSRLMAQLAVIRVHTGIRCLPRLHPVSSQ